MEPIRQKDRMIEQTAPWPQLCKLFVEHGWPATNITIFEVCTQPIPHVYIGQVKLSSEPLASHISLHFIFQTTLYSQEPI